MRVFFYNIVNRNPPQLSIIGDGVESLAHLRDAAQVALREV